MATDNNTNTQKESNHAVNSAEKQKSHSLLYISLGVLVTALMLGSTYFALWSWGGRKCKSNTDCFVQDNSCLGQKTIFNWFKTPKTPWTEGEKCECVDGKCVRITCEEQGS